jgi:hypothetical protein
VHSCGTELLGSFSLLARCQASEKKWDADKIFECLNASGWPFGALAESLLAEPRMREALFALEDASVRGVSARDQLRFEQVYLQSVASYEALAVVSAGGISAL